jgi:DNA-binding transcriptional ArsR family regulator
MLCANLGKVIGVGVGNGFRCAANGCPGRGCRRIPEVTCESKPADDFMCADRAGTVGGELNKRVPLSQSALSQHLSCLRRAGLVSTRRRAQVVYYHTSDDRVRSMLVSLSALFCEMD